MQVYTLELVSQTPPEQANAADLDPAQPSRNWVLHYPASDVPEDVTLLIDFLHEQAAPLPRSQKSGRRDSFDPHCRHQTLRLSVVHTSKGKCTLHIQ